MRGIKNSFARTGPAIMSGEIVFFFFPKEGLASDIALVKPDPPDPYPSVMPTPAAGRWRARRALHADEGGRLGDIAGRKRTDLGSRYRRSKTRAPRAAASDIISMPSPPAQGDWRLADSGGHDVAPDIFLRLSGAILTSHSTTFLHATLARRHRPGSVYSSLLSFAVTPSLLRSFPLILHHHVISLSFSPFFLLLPLFLYSPNFPVRNLLL